ncbi:MAG: SGNH/GDSL hydrolase family protein, partial [Tepidisphaeraceae bacterium]
TRRKRRRFTESRHELIFLESSDATMNPILIHLGSGAGFFSGMALVALAIVFELVVPNRWMRAGSDIAVVVGMLLVGLSSTPVPPLVLPIWFVATLTAIVALHVGSMSMRTRAMLAAPAIMLCVVAAGIEAPHHFTPKPPNGTFSRLYVFGDSITAGVGRENGPRWPTIVRGDLGVDVVDLSRPGARINDMTRAAANARLGDGLVLVEIGGNDMIRRSSVESFERDLEDLLNQVKGPGRTVAVLELPLFPFHAELARAQRRVAAKHDVMLIPKRYFASVWAASDSTIDGLHLSGTGHAHFAQVVERLLGKSLRP